MRDRSDAPRTFVLPTRVMTGTGSAARLGAEALRLGRRALLVCTRGAAARGQLISPIQQALQEAGLSVSLYADLEGEPTLAEVEAGIAKARACESDLVIGLGGGSAMDAAKAIAGLTLLPGSVEAYHQGRSPDGPTLPLITVPTVAGSGAEITKNAVLTDPGRWFKASIRGDGWFPHVAVVDPALTTSVPPGVTASSGSDGLCQAIEAFVSVGASPVTDALAAEAIRRFGRSLVKAYEEPDDLSARADLSYGSLLAAMAFVNCRLGAVHGLAHPLGVRFDIPHGTVCGLLLPHVMAYNLPFAADKYARTADLLGVEGAADQTDARAHLALGHVRRLLERVGVEGGLDQFGVTEADFPDVIREALPSGSLKHNPRPLDASDLAAILRAAL